MAAKRIPRASELNGATFCKIRDRPLETFNSATLHLSASEVLLYKHGKGFPQKHSFENSWEQTGINEQHDEKNEHPNTSSLQQIHAVLPFVNMSEQTDTEYFSDGITEEIINALTTVEGLKVIARTSSFVFNNKNIEVRTIGTQLGVSTILEGSIRRV